MTIRPRTSSSSAKLRGRPSPPSPGRSCTSRTPSTASAPFTSRAGSRRFATRPTAGRDEAKMHFRKMHFSKMHFSKILQIFGGLVLGCIKTKFCKKICVWQHFSNSTRFAYFCTAAISKFSQKIGLKKQQFSWNFSKKLQMSQNLHNFVKFQKNQLENLVDFEKCCKTHICLHKSVPILPKTSNILPKNCQKLATTLRKVQKLEAALERRGAVEARHAGVPGRVVRVGRKHAVQHLCKCNMG